MPEENTLTQPTDEELKKMRSEVLRWIEKNDRGKIVEEKSEQKVVEKIVVNKEVDKTVDKTKVRKRKKFEKPKRKVAKAENKNQIPAKWLNSMIIVLTLLTSLWLIGIIAVLFFGYLIPNL